MEKRELSSTCTIEASDRGHCSGSPSGVAAQSTGSRSAPTSPPASRAARALLTESLSGIGDHVEDLVESGEVEDAVHGRRPVDGDGEAASVLLRALLLAHDHAQPAGIDEGDLPQVEYDVGRLGLVLDELRAQLRRGRQVDLATGDDHDRAITRLAANLEQGIERHGGEYTGSSTTTDVAWSGSDSTQTRPPWASTKPRTIASPRPDPR